MYNSKLYWHFLILASAITGRISISVFASLLAIPIAIANSTIGLKNFSIAAGIKKPIIKKNKKKHNKITLFAKSKLNSTEFLISTSLINSNISHDEFFLINNVMREYDDTKEETKILKT